MAKKLSSITKKIKSLKPKPRQIAKAKKVGKAVLTTLNTILANSSNTGMPGPFYPMPGPFKIDPVIRVASITADRRKKKKKK